MLAKSPHLTVRDNQANIVNTAQVEVLEAGTQNQAPVFQDRDGAVSLPQPFQVNTKGVISFYSEGGLYDLKITNDGDVTVLSDIAVGTAQGRDAAGSGDVITGPVTISDSEPSKTDSIWLKKSTEKKQATIFQGAYDESGNLFGVYALDSNNEVINVLTSGIINFRNYQNYNGGVFIHVEYQNDAERISYIDSDSNIITIEEAVDTAQDEVARGGIVTDRGLVYIKGDNIVLADTQGSKQSFATGLTGLANAKLSVSLDGNRAVIFQSDSFYLFDISGSTASQVGSTINATAFTASAGFELPSNYSVSNNSAYVMSRNSSWNWFGNHIDFVTGTATQLEQASSRSSGTGFDNKFAVGNNQNVYFYTDGSLTRTVDLLSSSEFGGSASVFKLFNFNGLDLVLGRDTDTEGSIYYPCVVDESFNVTQVANSFLSPGTFDFFNVDPVLNKGMFVNEDFGNDTFTAIFLDSDLTSTTETYTNRDKYQPISYKAVMAPDVRQYYRIFIDGKWVELANNLAERNIQKKSWDVGPDLSALDQAHDPVGNSTIFFQTEVTRWSKEFDRSVVIGQGCNGKFSQGVMLGDECYLDPGEAVSISGPIIIGADSGGYNAVAVIIGANAYAEQYSDFKGSANNGPIAIGESSYVGTNRSIGIGNDTYISNTNGFGIALGSSASVYGDYAISVGSNSEAYGLNAIAVGKDAYNNNQDGIGLGTSSNVSADNGIAIGYTATADGGQSVAIGSNASAGGNIQAVALGAGTTASSPYSVAIGDRQLHIQGDKGIRMKSPDGQEWDVTVDNTGNLVVTAFNAL